MPNVFAYLGSNVARHLALGASIAVHAMVAVAATGGHGRQGAGTPNREPEIVIPVELELSAPTTTSSETNVVEPTTPASAPRWPAHQHDYLALPDHDAHPHDPSLLQVVSTPDAQDGSKVVSTADVRPEAPVRFVLSAVNPVRGGGADWGGAMGVGVEQSGIDETFPEAEVSVPARVVSAAPVVYPPEARADEIETDVLLEIVVDNRGIVVEARPLSARGYGLEEAAVHAVRAYRFTPAERRGLPIRVRMRWTVLFRLR